MQKLILSLLFLSSCIWANELPYITSECDSLSLIEGVVSAYNGKLIQVDQDMVINGSDPLEFTRYYDAGHHFDSEFGYGVGCSFPALIHTVTQNNELYALVELRQGLDVLCKLEKKGSKLVGKLAKKFYKTGFTNCSDALLNGEASPYALTIELDKLNVIVSLGDGTKRYYSFFAGTAEEGYYRLDREDRSNGNHRHFSYTLAYFPFSLQKVWTTNSDESLEINSLSFEYKDNIILVDGSDQQYAAYALKTTKGKVKKGNILRGTKAELTTDLLASNLNYGYPIVHYEYTSNAQSIKTLFSMTKAHSDDGKSLEVEYDKLKRVKELKFPGQSQPIHTFDYHTNYTDVTDARGARKRFEFDNRRLIKLSESHRSQNFAWDEKGQLKSHTIFSANGEQVSQRKLEYNSLGSITKLECVWNYL